MTDKVSNSIKIMIAGEEYPVISNTDPKKLIEIADFLNLKIKEVAKSVSNRERYRVAILTAINIAGELFEEREKNSKNAVTFEKIRDKTQEIFLKLEGLEQVC